MTQHNVIIKNNDDQRCAHLHYWNNCEKEAGGRLMRISTDQIWWNCISTRSLYNSIKNSQCVCHLRYIWLLLVVKIVKPHVTNLYIYCTYKKESWNLRLQKSYTSFIIHKTIIKYLIIIYKSMGTGIEVTVRLHLH